LTIICYPDNDNNIDLYFVTIDIFRQNSNISSASNAYNKCQDLVRIIYK